MAKTKNKFHVDDAAAYDALETFDFDTVTPAGAVTNAAISARYPLPIAVKFDGVVIVQATGTNLVTAFNVIMFTAADATPSNPTGTPDTQGAGGSVPPAVAANGTAFFAADQAVTLVADVPQFFPIAKPNNDVIYPQNALLTLRLVSAGAGGACKVVLLGRIFDIHQYRQAFDPSNL